MPDAGDAGFDATTDVFAVSGMVELVVTAPFTLVRATPKRLDPGFELITARVGFHGLTGSRTPSRYMRANGLPGIMCGDEPVTGHGPTYPAENLRLLPGDNTIRLLFYLRAIRPGVQGAYGYRIDFALADGRTGSVSGEGRETHITAWAAGDQPPGGQFLTTYCPFDEWTTRAPGYPA